MSMTLRDLPLPVKVVASVFLMAVGLGYTSAMVQLHMQDSKSGQPMPTVEDVILKYTGKKWFDTDPPRPVSKLERLIMGSIAPDAVFNGSGSMAPAFFSKDPSVGPKKYANLVKATPDKVAEIDAQREGERKVLKAWLNADKATRLAAYEADAFVPPDGQAPASIDPDWKTGTGYKVKSIIDARCVACHGNGGPQANFPLETYEQLDKYMTAPTVSAVPPGGGYVRIEDPVSMDKLTQTTHTHLLSFAMLFSLTGVIYAFSSHPKFLRLIFGPWVTVAVTADVSLWWLARLSDEWGPHFAKGIILTGGMAGLGLAVQIVCSLFNMYGLKGKAVIAAFFLMGAGIGGLVVVNKIKPAIDAKTQDSPVKQGIPDVPPAKKDDGKKIEPKGPAAPALSQLDRVLVWPVKADGKDWAVLELPFSGKKDGGMVRAFFDRDDGGFKDVMKDKDTPQADKDALTASRHGELSAIKAWMKAADPQRRTAYDTDAFDLPAELKGKPVTADYVKDGRAKVKSILTDRCVRCHLDGGERSETQLDSYEKLLKEMGAGVVAAPPPAAGNAAPAPPAPKPVDAIPPSKD